MSDLSGVRPASRTLGDLVDEMAAAIPNAEALVFRDERLDYAGLKARVDVFARALLAVGIQRGDRVALLVTNRTEWVVAAFAHLISVRACIWARVIGYGLPCRCSGRLARPTRCLRP